MAKKHAEGYLSAKESRKISKENRRITNQYEKQRKRKNVPESEYLTQMRDPKNAVEFDTGDTLSADPLRIRFPGYNDITLSQSDTDIPIVLTNPTGNPCLFQFDVTLDESTDSLLHSNWVEPGKALESVPLPSTLSPGDHTLHVAISTRSLDGTEPMNGGSVTVQLHVA